MKMTNAILLFIWGCGEPKRTGEASEQTISTTDDTGQSTDDQPADLDGDGYGDNDCDDSDDRDHRDHRRDCEFAMLRVKGGGCCAEAAGGAREAPRRA